MLHPTAAETVFPLSAGQSPRQLRQRARALPDYSRPLGFALGQSALRPDWSGRRARLLLSPLIGGK